MQEKKLNPVTHTASVNGENGISCTVAKTSFSLHNTQHSDVNTRNEKERKAKITATSLCVHWQPLADQGTMQVAQGTWTNEMYLDSILSSFCCISPLHIKKGMLKSRFATKFDDQAYRSVAVKPVLCSWHKRCFIRFFFFFSEQKDWRYNHIRRLFPDRNVLSPVFCNSIAARCNLIYLVIISLTEFCFFSLPLSEVHQCSVPLHPISSISVGES